MAAAVDIAGAVAPAAVLPSSASDVRADGTARSGNAAGAAKSHGAKASAAGKAGTDEASAFDNFDAQLEAALPGSEDQQDGSAPKAAAKGGEKSARAADEPKGRGSDPIPTAAVLTPWTFIQPVEVTPVKADATSTAAEPTKDKAETSDAGGSSLGPAIAARTVGVGSDTTVADASSLADEIAPATGAKTARTKDAAPTTDAVPGKNATSGKPAAFAQDGAPATDEDVTTVGESKAGAATKGDPASTTAAKVAVPETPSAQPSAQPSSVSTGPASTATTAPKAEQPALAVEQIQAQPVATAQAQATAANASLTQTSAVPVAPVEPRAAAEVPAKDASVAPATRAARGEKSSATGRSISAFRAGTQTDVSQTPGQGKGNHTSHVDASANVGSVDQRRGPASEDNGAPTTAPATAEPKAAEVLLQHDSAPVVTTARESQTMTTVVAGVGGAGSSAAEVLIAGDAPVMSAGDVPDPDTPQRLVQTIRMQFLRGGGDAVVQLNPEHLGPVTVSLRVEQGSVEARITAANPVVAEWLKTNHETLRDGLQASGLTLDRLVVDRDGRSPDRRERRESPARQRFRPASEAKSTFELTI